MKKLTIILFALLTCNILFAQDEDFDPFGKRNELKLNLPTTIFGSYPEISYERILNSDISVGASFGVGLDKDYYNFNFAFTPYFRWFFGGSKTSMQKVAAGFFIEANGSLFSRNNEVWHDYSYGVGNNYTYAYSYKDESEFGAGFGLAIGWKYLTKIIG